jgi:drug/metabolite transporter (DMT)-like permease
MMTVSAAEDAAPGHTTRNPRPGVWLTDLSLLMMALIWGVNFSVVKYATGLLHPLAFNAVRVALAATALMLIGAIRRDAWPDRRVILMLLLLGVLGNGVYQVFFVEGLAKTRAGDAALVIAATPAFIALLGMARGIERIGARGWLGIMLSVIGIGCITFGKTHDHVATASVIGDMLILCGSLAWAIYTVLLKPYTHSVDGVKLSAITMVGGAIPLFIFAFPDVMAAEWALVPPSVWGAMAYSGLGALVVAYLFWYRGVRIIGPTLTAMYSNLQPLFAVIVAWILLGELPTVWQGIGAASITSGLILTRT